VNILPTLNINTIKSLACSLIVCKSNCALSYLKPITFFYVVLLFSSLVSGQKYKKRNYFNQKLEPIDKILHGAGQVMEVIIDDKQKI